MPNPKTDPTAFVMQAALSPDDPTLEASTAGMQAIDAEIDRLRARIERLEKAKANIKKRMRAA